MCVFVFYRSMEKRKFIYNQKRTISHPLQRPRCTNQEPAYTGKWEGGRGMGIIKNDLFICVLCCWLIYMFLIYNPKGCNQANRSEMREIKQICKRKLQNQKKRQNLQN